MSDRITPPPVSPAGASAQPPAVTAPVEKKPDEFSFPELNFQAALDAEDAAANADTAPPAERHEPQRATPVAETQPSTPVAATPEPKPATPAAPVAEAPAPAKPAEQPAPAPRTFDPNEKYALDDGLEYTRAQLRTGLENGIAAHQEAQTFRQVFGMTAAEAQTAWGPLLQDVNADPAFGKYLEEAITHYQTQRAATRPQPTEPVIDQRIAARIDGVERELTARKQHEAIAAATTAIQQEVADLTQRYPALSDLEVYEDLKNFALIRCAKDPSYTLTRAAHDRAAWLSRLAPGQAPTPAPQTVPALLSGGGPSPNGSASPQLPEDDDVVGSGRDVVAEYMRERGLARR